MKQPKGPKTLALLEALRAPSGLTTPEARDRGLLGAAQTLYSFGRWLQNTYDIRVRPYTTESRFNGHRPLTRYRVIA